MQCHLKNKVRDSRRSEEQLDISDAAEIAITLLRINFFAKSWQTLRSVDWKIQFQFVFQIPTAMRQKVHRLENNYSVDWFITLNN